MPGKSSTSESQALATPENVRCKPCSRHCGRLARFRPKKPANVGTTLSCGQGSKSHPPPTGERKKMNARTICAGRLFLAIERIKNPHPEGTRRTNDEEKKLTRQRKRTTLGGIHLTDRQKAAQGIRKENPLQSAPQAVRVDPN